MITINNDEKVCYVDNESISLTKLEYKLLDHFLNNINKVFSREDLIKVAWTESVSNRTVDTAISRLRKKIGKYSKNLISRSGFGYGFIEHEKN